MVGKIPGDEGSKAPDPTGSGEPGAGANPTNPGGTGNGAAKKTGAKSVERVTALRGRIVTRGRRPLNALNDALEIAGRRGSVEEVAGKRGCAFDFIICEPDRNMFVKVKRSQTLFTYEMECLQRYWREIASLHRVALTHVTAREFWVRSPKITWQFFLIRHDSIREIRADGMYIPRESIPMRTMDFSGTDSDGTDDPISPFKDRE